MTEIGDTLGETDERESHFTKRKMLPAFNQFCGGIDDFFLLREGHKNSSKSPSSGQCAPTSKNGLPHSLIYPFGLIDLFFYQNQNSCLTLGNYIQHP